ncbi:sporulation integral membrane protein YtvI [Halobacillus karajensis]|uniref:sporulation integral membrane protein YtvI n=1 Tax=Halobacillus karajensis TaxID=195088 RepID=UPI0008A80E9A|nr:sporulation integral membrane protein YtvI [Halobacillus karajensis]SEI06064.1 sporulation integral membrane protein YtvI [Halobacillus karajensis]
MENQILQVGLRAAYILVILTGIILLSFFSWVYLQPFVIALVFSVMLQPFILLLDRRLHLPRTVSILLVLLIFGGLLGSLMTLLLAELIRGIQFLGSDIPGYFSRLTNYISNEFMNLISPLSAKIESLTSRLSLDQQQSLDEYMQLAQERFSETGISVLNRWFESLGTFLAGLPASFTSMFITLLATFFICKDWERILGFFQKSFPHSVSKRIHVFRNELLRTLKGLIRAQCTLVLISTTIIGIGLHLIQAPHPLTITFLAALVDFIPYVGTGIIFLPWILYQFLSGEFMMTISLSILYMIVLLTRQSLEPKLLADHFGVPPITLLMSLFLGFQIFGGLGMIISPIALMIIQTLNKTGVTHEVWTFISGK